MGGCIRWFACIGV